MRSSAGGPTRTASDARTAAVIRRRRLTTALTAVLAAIGLGIASAQTPDVGDLRASFRQAYDAADWATAIAIGERLEQASPGSQTLAYNLACVHARAGDAERALAWLERSAERGFRSARLMAGDPDLATLRPLPAYARVLATVEANATKAFEAFKPQADAAPVLVVLPSAAYEEGLVPLPLIVMLHGYGATPDDVAPAFRVLAERVGAVLAVPQAVEPAGSGYDWGELDHAEYLVMRALDVARSRALVAPRRVVLAGFSQGASVAYAVGLRHPETFAGIIAIAGAYDQRASPLPSPMPGRMPRFVVMCGSADRGVERSRQAARLLESAGLDVRLRIFEGIGHKFPPYILNELQDAVRFVFR